jgi:hypothetical protein
VSAPRRLTTTLIRNACNELLVLQQGHRERLLTHGDVLMVISMYREAAGQARRLGLTGTARAVVDGGAIPLCYGASAETTRITVTAGDVLVERVQSRRVAHGDNGLQLRAIPAPDITAQRSRIRGAWKYEGEIRW